MRSLVFRRMDVSHPIRGIIPTLDAPVIEILAATSRGLSGREVHRLAGTGSVRGVQLVLARLVKQGLVHADETPSATFYTANRKHLAWSALEALVGIRGQLMQRLRDDIGDWRIAPLHVSLFGSTARRDGSARSDIDLLVVRPEGLDDANEPWERQIDQLRDGVATWTGNRCQVLSLDRVRLGAHVAAGDPLVASWLRDGILLVGEPLGPLVDEVRAASRP